jgi:hypothetical protein
VGGLIAKPTDADVMRAWILSTGEYTVPYDPTVKKPRWSSLDTTIPPIADPALASTISASVAAGIGFLIAGQQPGIIAIDKVYLSALSGLIETTLDGVTGLTVSDQASFASFVVPLFTADWDVAGYSASIDGSWKSGMVKLEISFDDGVTFHTVTPDVFTTITDSSAPGLRHARITLYNFRTAKPIVTKLREIFDQDGGDLESRNVLRFNAITGGVRYFFVARDGQITLSDTITPSTPDKALLAKITPTGSTTAPTIVAYVNQRNAHRRYRGTAGITPATVTNELAIEPKFVRAYGIDSGDGHLYDLADPATIEFGTNFTLTGITNGDDYVFEVEA